MSDSIFSQSDPDPKWSTLAHKVMNYLPPGRPSKVEIEEIERFISLRFGSSTEVRALVLGATPEFRDMLCRLGASITLVDKNIEMIEAMDHLQLYSCAEEVYVDDWFNFLATNEQRFELILSDFTQGNIPYERQDLFYQLIARSLTDEGYLVDRVLTFRDRTLSSTVEELLEHYSTATVNLITLNDIMFRLFFVSDIIWDWQVVDVDRICSLMQQHQSANSATRHLAALMKEFIFGDGVVWYYGKKWAELSEHYFRHLSVVKEIADNATVYRGFAYIIISKAKR